MTGLEPLLLGSAATAATAGAATTAGVMATAGGLSAAGIAGTAATTGLFGAGGAFSLGTALGTMGQAFSAINSFGAANYNAQVNRNNAIIAQQNAEAQAKKQDRLARITAGQNIASIGKGGGTVAGSALDLLEDNALEDALNIATIRQQGQLKSQGFMADAKAEEFRGRGALAKGFVGAGRRLLVS